MDKERLLGIIIIHTNLTRKVVSKSVRVRKFSTLVSTLVHWYTGKYTGKAHEVKGIRIVTAKNPDN